VRCFARAPCCHGSRIPGASPGRRLIGSTPTRPRERDAHYARHLSKEIHVVDLKQFVGRSASDFWPLRRELFLHPRRRLGEKNLRIHLPVLVQTRHVLLLERVGRFFPVIT